MTGEIDPDSVRASAVANSVVDIIGDTPVVALDRLTRGLSETVPRAERMEAAARAAPCVHPRLAAIEYTASTISVQQPFDLSHMDREQREKLKEILEARLAREGQAVPPQLEAAGTDKYSLEHL